MKIGKRSDSRPYRQAARAVAAEATVQHVVEAFSDSMRVAWFDEITLDEVARRAGVTVRTVIRRFGGKEGLLQAFVEDFVPRASRQRESPPGDVTAAIGGVLDLYEAWGDSFIRHLAQESRYPALKPLLDRGRREHRGTTEAAFAPWLDRLTEPWRQRTLDALVAATDIYLWQLLRRDIGRSHEEVGMVMRMLVGGVLADAAIQSTSGRKGP